MPDSTPPPSLTIEPGAKLDRYELLCLLARGGMANVWLARMAGKHGFEKLLAIKTILPNEADNESFKEMFLDEARLASRINHQSVVRVTDVGESGGVPYLVMELIEGEALDKLVRSADKAGVEIPVGVALRIVADACHGLQAAHELKDLDGAPLHVVHRDMSPQNILVTAAGLAKIIDFGIAKARDRCAGPTTAGTLKGKISFMPKEQALGKEVDARADTWALGAVLYYLLAGRPPYKEETQLATLRMAMSAAPIEPLAQTVPALVRSFVNKALTHDIAGRFQTAAEMGEALEGLIRRLGSSTSHADTSAFVKSVLHDKLEARKRLVNKALVEAANRERDGVDLTIPIFLEHGNESTSVESGAFPALGSGSASGQLPRPEDSAVSHPGPQSIGTVGTFGGSYQAPRVPIWQSVALAAVALMGAVGIVLMVIVLLSRNSQGAKAAAREAPAPPVTTAAAAASAAASAPAEPSATAATVTPSASVTPSARATPPASGSVATNARPPVAVQAPFQAAFQAKPAAAPAAKPPQAKKRDDEAGF